MNIFLYYSYTYSKVTLYKKKLFPISIISWLMASVLTSLANKLARRLSDTQVPSSVRFDVDGKWCVWFNFQEKKIKF